MSVGKIAILGSLSLAGCGGPDVPAQTPEAAAAAINAILPKDMGAGAIVESAEADGEQLVLKLDKVIEIDAPGGDETTAATVKVYACRDATYRTVIDQGIDIRFELTGMSGRKLPSVMVEECT